MKNRLVIAASLTCCFATAAFAAQPKEIKVLFLGDTGHHQPVERFRLLQPELAKRGIELTYTDRLEDLNARTLAAYDGLLIYANHTKILPDQEQALLDYVASGKGFIPIHCASACFGNSPKYIELVGAQFQRHGTGVFRTQVAEPESPILKSFGGFESWDETYVHQKHNEVNRTVLEYRDEQGRQEPWTWTRTHGKGRVFYTAWGHDQRTWNNPGFQNLIERGIRWAVGADPAGAPAFADRPEMTPLRKDVKPFEYVEADVPFYPASGGRKGDEKIKRMQLPLDPAESMKHFTTPVGFEVQLFAAEPDLGGKPIAMNWDARGRLWVLETVDYPNELQGEGQGRDRIRICEDTNGDGRADKFTVFADQLSIPTSLTFSRDGVIVHQAPHTLFLRDTNGDDVADERQVLFTGWSTGDTHAGPNNLQYGLDNWIFGMVGYAGFSGEVGGEKLSFKQGFYRFRPDGSKLEFLRSTNNNTWGLGFSEEGVLFGSTANGNPSVYMPIANRYYESVRGWSSSVLGAIAESDRFDAVTDAVRQVDHHGSFTAAAGHALYTARTYPREYWNRAAFVTDPTGHLTATFLIEPSGADFRSHNAWNLLAGNDEWSAPIMAEVGPDGHVWVIDWYNFIVQHNPTPAGFKTGKGNAYETDLRDKKHGRIYRVVYKQAPAYKPMSLENTSPEELVAALKNPNMFWRKHAQRLLVERGQRDVVPALVELVHDEGLDEIGLNAGAIHALWTLHGLGVIGCWNAPGTRAAVAALKHRSAGVRRAALGVLCGERESQSAILASGVLGDEDFQVRLAALLALAEMPRSEFLANHISACFRVPTMLQDRTLADALTSAAAAQHVGVLLDLFSARDAATFKPVAFSQAALDRIAIVAEHAARVATPRSGSALVGGLVAAQPQVAEAVLAGFVRGWPRDKKLSLDESNERSLVALLPRLAPVARGQLLSLARRWGTDVLESRATEIAAAYLQQARDEKAADTERIAAAGQLIEFRKSEVDPARELLDLVTPRTSPELATGLLDAVGRSESADVGPEIASRLSAFTPTARQAALRVMLIRAPWTHSLVAGLEKGQIRAAELSLDQKQALTAHPDKSLAGRLNKILAAGGGLPNPDRQKVLAELMPLCNRRGDAAAGKEVFKKTCAKCHTHGGEGAKIGPDLTGMAVHPKAELLMHVIDPSRSVEGNYRVYTVVTSDGRVVSGLLASESKTSIELFDAEGKKHALLREDVDELVASPKSLMPEGFEKQATPDDLVNLLEFLTTRGKYLPIPLDKVSTIVSTRGMFYSVDAQAERLIFSDWSSKTFDGIPFHLVDPQEGRRPNVVLLNSPNGKLPPQMPKSVSLPCNAPTKAIHLLSGVSGWGYPLGEKGSVSLIVRLHYADGQTEDHPLANGIHFADYIRRVEVPKSKFAYALRNQQVRYLAVYPKRTEAVKNIEFVKGPDKTAPVIVAVTIEGLN